MNQNKNKKKIILGITFIIIFRLILHIVIHFDYYLFVAQAMIDEKRGAETYYFVQISDKPLMKYEACMLIRMLPEEIINKFSSNDWKIYSMNNMSKLVTNELLKDTSVNKENIAGITVMCEKRIYLRENESTLNASILHEFGHFCDYTMFGYPSNNNKFISIYELEKNKLPIIQFKTLSTSFSKKYSASTSQEFFAETFKDYIIEPEKLKKACPKTYEYIDNLFLTYCPSHFTK